MAERAGGQTPAVAREVNKKLRLRLAKLGSQSVWSRLTYISFCIVRLYSAFSIVKDQMTLWSDRHITVYLTSYSWKQSRILCMQPLRVLLTVIWPVRLGFEPKASSSHQNVDALDHKTQRHQKACLQVCDSDPSQVPSRWQISTDQGKCFTAKMMQ